MLLVTESATGRSFRRSGGAVEDDEEEAQREHQPGDGVPTSTR
jgi:hypothetical protein